MISRNPKCWIDKKNQEGESIDCKTKFCLLICSLDTEALFNHGFVCVDLVIQQDFTVGNPKNVFMVETLRHQNWGSNVGFETL